MVAVWDVEPKSESAERIVQPNPSFVRQLKHNGDDEGFRDAADAESVCQYEWRSRSYISITDAVDEGCRAWQPKRHVRAGNRMPTAK